MSGIARIYLVCGGPGSGKDALIQAVKDMGSLHARIVPKHTTRIRRRSDGEEMICADDSAWDLKSCDLQYVNHGDTYGVRTSDLWDNLMRRMPQVLVVSNHEAIQRLTEIFGRVVVLIYVHSDIAVDDFASRETSGQDDGYVKRRSVEYNNAFRLYISNMKFFRHVVIYSGAQEDMFDQMFRIFAHYESSVAF